jgi:hypothetical protein
MNITDSIPVNDKFLSYSYPSCALFNKGQWEKLTMPNNANPYYKITYPSECTNNSADLIYAQDGIFTNYQAKYIYFYG